ncbi:MAG TPA: DUF542 domain-containing protein [Solirubrobacteraceae bacterium]|nr:DUF542 domain-containing protein [Solirubrobacteraceae bacterium]
MVIDPEMTLGRLVAEHPQCARLLEELHLDFCCGGEQTLAAAASARGLDGATVALACEAFARIPQGADQEGERDWLSAGIPELCDHIVECHHERVRRERPRIEELLATVVRVHGAKQPELALLQDTFRSMAAGLERHMAREEQQLFPACRGAAAGAGVDEQLLALHAGEHEQVGAQLGELRALGGGYNREGALCSTHRSLLGALERFEADLHRHIHEENNILFPRVRALGAAGAAAQAPRA